MHPTVTGTTVSQNRIASFAFLCSRWASFRSKRSESVVLLGDRQAALAEDLMTNDDEDECSGAPCLGRHVDNARRALFAVR